MGHDLPRCFKKVSSGCWVEKRQKRGQGRRNQEAISVGQVRNSGSDREETGRAGADLGSVLKVKGRSSQLDLLTD